MFDTLKMQKEKRKKEKGDAFWLFSYARTLQLMNRQDEKTYRRNHEGEY